MVTAHQDGHGVSTLRPALAICTKRRSGLPVAAIILSRRDAIFRRTSVPHDTARAQNPQYPGDCCSHRLHINAIVGVNVHLAGAQPTQQCRTVESTREVVNGYNVYHYNDRDVNVALPYNPGSTIKVGVGVILDERAADSGHAPECGAYRGAQPIIAADPAAATNNTSNNYRY